MPGLNLKVIQAGKLNPERHPRNEESCNTTPTLITVNCNLKLMASEKATKLEKIFHIFLKIVVVVQASKYMGKFISNFVAFSENITNNMKYVLLVLQSARKKM